MQQKRYEETMEAQKQEKLIMAGRNRKKKSDLSLKYSDKKFCFLFFKSILSFSARALSFYLSLFLCFYL